MTYKSALWHPIALVLTVVNVAGIGFAVAAAEPWHAAAHVVLALAFASWARRLRPARGGGELEPRLEALEAEVHRLRLEVNETQERLDFAERLLAQGTEARRVGPQR